MKLWNPSQGQTTGQLVAQVILSVLQGREGCALDLLIAPNSNDYMGMATIWGHVYGVYLDWKQARIRHLEADQLDQFFTYRFRYSSGSPFVHLNRSLTVAALLHPFHCGAYQLGA
jgi:hypothetical protein